jgi:signal transduction histidine kinase
MKSPSCSMIPRERAQPLHQQEQLFQQIAQLLNTEGDLIRHLTESFTLIGNCFRVDRIILESFKENNPKIWAEWHLDEKIPPFPAIDVIEKHYGCLAQKFCQWYDEKSCPLAPLYFQGELSLLLPIRVTLEGKFYGYFILQRIHNSQPFTQQEQEILEEIGNLLGVFLKKEEQKQQLKEIQSEINTLKSANEHKKQFLSHIHHELRTPLTAILGFARMLKEEIYGPLNDKQLQYSKAIVSSGEHLLSLVNDFLDLSKIEANKEELFWETFPVEEICLASFSMLEAKAEQQGLELKLEIGENITSCRADQRRLKQILVNLLSNAIKFTEEGSITLKVELNASQLAFSVIDTGIGISEEDQKKLFSSFQQINNALTRKQKGTGLGLLLSRKLAQLHGGEITLTSTVGQGSCFTVYIPV